MGRAWPMVGVVVEGDLWHLWLVAWLCHPHMCLFAIHHKWHLPHMPTFCCTTPNGWQDDLVTCYHALVGCFLTTPLPFPTTIVSSSFSIHPFFSPIHHHGCLITFEMNLMTVTSVSSSFFTFQLLVLWGLLFCEVSMEPFFFLLIVCVILFNMWGICHVVFYHHCV